MGTGCNEHLEGVKHVQHIDVADVYIFVHARPAGHGFL